MRCVNQVVVRDIMTPTTPKPLRLAVLLSGGGTTLQNMIDLIARNELPATVELVIASRPDAYGLQRAAKAGIPTLVIPRKGIPPDEFSRRMQDAIRAARADLVCMAGFLSLWTIPDDYAGRVMNIHPGLLPSFGGKGYYGHHVHEAVINAGCKVSGCTVHLADNVYDHGPIIVQRCVPVLEDDTPDALAARVFEQECIAYPEAIRLFAEGRLRIDGHRVRILPAGTL
jgi:phosphoribosylglycinamide formyltransferase 1